MPHSEKPKDVEVLTGADLDRFVLDYTGLLRKRCLLLRWESDADFRERALNFLRTKAKWTALKENENGSDKRANR